jgi:putative ABC transport system ATP-binding protein
VLRAFREVHEAGNTIVMVTHDPDVGAEAARTIRIADGQVAA